MSDLGDQIRAVLFTPVRRHGSYDMEQVDAFLDTLAEAADAGRPLGPLVEAALFHESSVRKGYAVREVDAFLDRVAGPTPPPAGEPALPSVVQEQRGLLSRLLRRD